MSKTAIEIRNLSKTFPGGAVAVHGLDLDVPEGAVCGLIGRNGAGKTTTLRILMGLLRANRGSARIFGHELWNAPRPVKQRVAYVSQLQRLAGWMTLEELYCYLGQLYDKWDSRKAHHLAARFDLELDRPVGLLSGGQQRIASVLLALCAQPDVLILDEPAAGLDPIARRQLVEELIEFMADGDSRTVLFSTHIIADLERVADHVAILDRGHVVAQGRLDDFQSRMRRVQVIFETSMPPEGFRVPGAVRSVTEGPVVTAVARLESEAALDPIRRLPGARVNVFPLGLEEIFIELLGPEAHQELTTEVA